MSRSKQAGMVAFSPSAVQTSMLSASHFAGIAFQRRLPKSGLGQRDDLDARALRRRR
jgi:hypothetical protein